MLKPYSFTVSYDLSLILITVMFKGFNYFCCTYYYQHYIYLIFSMSYVNAFNYVLIAFIH